MKTSRGICGGPFPQASNHPDRETEVTMPGMPEMPEMPDQASAVRAAMVRDSDVLSSESLRPRYFPHIVTLRLLFSLPSTFLHLHLPPPLASIPPVSLLWIPGDLLASPGSGWILVI